VTGVRGFPLSLRERAGVRGQQNETPPMLDHNILFYGDNLEFLSDPDVFPTESVDLIYLDPPFNSNAS